MASLQSAARTASCERNLCKLFDRLQLRGQCRYVSAGTLRFRSPPPPRPLPERFRNKDTDVLFPPQTPASRKIKIYSPPLQVAKKKSPVCPEPLKAWNASQVAVMDPSSARTRLFSPDNPDGVRVGDVLLVRFRSGEPFAGVLMNIRRRGIDTGALLRNELTRVGTEMWVKIYSPNVTGMEIVERRAKRARRARLYYMRKKKHDRGSLQGLLERYLKNKAATGRGVARANRTRPQAPANTTTRNK